MALQFHSAFIGLLLLSPGLSAVAQEALGKPNFIILPVPDQPLHCLVNGLE